MGLGEVNRSVLAHQRNRSVLSRAAVEEALYENRAAFARHYQGIPGAKDPRSLARDLIGSLKQAPRDAFLTEVLTDTAVFRAAVRSLGSNSRTWVTYTRGEAALEQLLYGFDPFATFEALLSGKLTVDRLRPFFPGQSGRNDALAVLEWAGVLVRRPEFYRRLLLLAHELSSRYEDYRGTPPTHAILFLLLVAHLSGLPRVTLGIAEVSCGQAITTKLPGMRHALTSEFLRNLGWSGFKPDRHIVRLFDHWKLDHTTVSEEVASIGEVLMRKDRDTTRYLEYSLLGIRITPAGEAYSDVDNLLWLLGAYVERKGRESEKSYFVDQPR